MKFTAIREATFYAENPDAETPDRPDALRVAEKAACYGSQAKARLAHFIFRMIEQAKGAAAVAEQIVDAVLPDTDRRPATPRQGAHEVEVVHLDDSVPEAVADSRASQRRETAEQRAARRTAERQCACDRLAAALLAFCGDPAAQLDYPGETERDLKRERERLAYEFSRQVRDGFRMLEVPYFKHLGSALEEYRARRAETLARGFVETETSRKLSDLFAKVQRERAAGLFTGEPGVGKSATLRHLAAVHAGGCVLLELKAWRNRAVFFEDLAAVVGVRPGYHLQRRVERFLELARPVVIIDEAQRLWGDFELLKPKFTPTLIEWAYSALVDQKIPALLVATPAFHQLRQIVEEGKKNGPKWNGLQFDRRFRWTVVDGVTTPPAADFDALAASLLPEAPARVRDLVVGLAVASGRGLTAVRDLAETSLHIAHGGDRETPSQSDVETAGRHLLAGYGAARSAASAPAETSTCSRRKPGAPYPDAKYVRRTDSGLELREEGAASRRTEQQRVLAEPVAVAK